MRIKKMILRVLLLVILTAVVSLAFIYKDYKAFIETAYVRLSEKNYETMSSSFGKIAYQISGEGTPVLVVHGITGGFDQAMDSGKSLFPDGYKIVAPSRFGYPGSDLPTESSPKNQADAYADLLDYLDIDSAIIIATSAGGSPALRFAMQYPEKTKALIMLSAGVPSQKSIDGPTGPPHFLYNDFIFYILTQKMPNMLYSMFGLNEADVKNSTYEDKEQLRIMFDHILPVKIRRPGIFNDEQKTNTDAHNYYHEYNLERINTPVLFLQAKDDPMIDFQDIASANNRLPNSTLVEFEKGGHIIYCGEVDKEIERFLKINNID